jgi:hypothetical protein
MSQSKLRPQQPGSGASAGLRIIPQRKGNEVVLTIRREIGAPARSVYVDYVSVTTSSGDVSLIFGKLRPKLFSPESARPTLRFLIEVSFPKIRFCEQFDALVREPQDGQPPFFESLERSVGSFPVQDITKLPTPELTGNGQEYAGIRANTAYFYLQDEEACLDFFYLDAATVHSMRDKGAGPAPIPGLLRVILTPPMLLSLLRQCRVVAAELAGKSLSEIDHADH